MTTHDTITDAQRAALAKLAPLLGEEFYLAGGVGLAAHFAHRISRDLDLFSTSDPTVLQSRLPFLPGVDLKNLAPGTLHLQVDGIPVSLLEYPYPLLMPAEPRAELPVPVASLEDLAAMKLSAVAGRGAARDFWDIHTIVERAARPLRELLDAFKRKYPIEDVGHVIRSLVYFGDARGPLPTGLTPQHWNEIQRDFEAWVSTLSQAE